MIEHIKKHSPIYINTLNIFRPFKTWLKNMFSNWTDIVHRPLDIQIYHNKESFDYVIHNFYTWYWWDHPWVYDFAHKRIIVIIDDVQYKYTFGLRELESVPFIFIRMFGHNLFIEFNAPRGFDNYEYWENLR